MKLFFSYPFLIQIMFAFTKSLPYNKKISHQKLYYPIIYLDFTMKNEEKSQMKTFISELYIIYERIKSRFDWNKIDNHSSLRFLDRNYQMKPSDIARKLLYLIGFIVLYIQGFRALTILMCYLLPIGIMILKICELMKTKKKKPYQAKEKLKLSRLSGLESKLEQRNESELSINSKQNESKSESQSEQELIKNNVKKQAQNRVQKKSINGQSGQEVTINELCKVFIFYLVINLVVELSEPLLLLIIDTSFSLGQVGIRSVQELIVDGNFWVLVMLPFRFISTFLAQVFSFNQANETSKIVLVLLRVFLSAFLLNLNQQQKQYCTKILFQQKLSCLSPQSPTDQKHKKD